MSAYESSFPVRDGDRVIGRVYLRTSRTGTSQPGITLGTRLAREAKDVTWLGVYGRAQACADFGADECRYRSKNPA